MSNEVNGGNVNNTTGSSPESADSSLDVDSVGSSANEPAMSPREFLSRRQEIRERKAESANSTAKPQRTANMTKAKSTVSVAESGEEASEKNDDSQSLEASAEKPQKDTKENFPKFQQRIDKLTAKYHEAERKAAQKDIQIEKLTKATEILQKELDRISKFAKLDPKEERIRELEYAAEVNKFTDSLNNKEEQLYNKSVSEYTIQTRADEILEEVTALTSEYDLVSPEEILIAMRDKNMTATQAARSIHNARLELANKRTKVQHPTSVSKVGAPGTNQPDEPYRGSETIRKFFLQRIAERSGKAE